MPSIQNEGSKEYYPWMLDTKCMTVTLLRFYRISLWGTCMQHLSATCNTHIISMLSHKRMPLVTGSTHTHIMVCQLSAMHALVSPWFDVSSYFTSRIFRKICPSSFFFSKMWLRCVKVLVEAVEYHVSVSCDPEVCDSHHTGGVKLSCLGISLVF